LNSSSSISKKRLIVLLRALSGDRDTDAVIADIRARGDSRLSVSKVPRNEIVDVWDSRAERGRAKGEDVADIDRLLGGLADAREDHIGMITVAGGRFLSAVFVSSDLERVYSFLRRPDRRAH
jgi:hypothetical protein